MPRVLIADDHAVVRRGLKQILALELDAVQVGEAADAAELRRELQRQKWDLVVMDLSMPGADGLELLKDLKRSHADVPILVLSMHAEDQFAIRSLRAGADGYLTKEAAPATLAAAVRKLLAGGKYISEALAHKAIVAPATGDRPLHELLSDREYQVLRALATGRSAKEIAHDLRLSAKTVSTYRARVLEKLQLRTNADLIQYALRNGILS